MNRRLIIIISAIVLLLVLLGGMLFWAYKKQHQNQQPAVQQPTLKKVLDETVISPVASFDNSAIWYFNKEARLFRVNLDGSGLSEFPLPSLGSDLRSVIWPKTGSDFIVISNSGGQFGKSYYDSAQKLYVNLAPNVKYIDWMPDGKRVVYIWQTSDNNHQSLVLASPDGSGFRTIKDVFWPDLIVKVSPNGKKVLLYRGKIEGNENKIYIADIATGQIDTAVGSGKNLAAAWTSADSFLFAQADLTAYPKVYSYNVTSKQAVDLNLNTSLDKVVTDKDGKYLYAAVPRKDNTGDSFIKLDLSTVKQDTYYEPSQDIRAGNMMMLGNTLYFTNTRDGKLYTVVK